MIYPDGAIVEGGYVDASDNTPTIAGDGCTFIGVTFMNPAKFGEGCVFVNCIFLDAQDSKHTNMHETGDGNVFSGCQFNYVRFGANNVSDTIPIGVRPNTIGSNMVMTPSSTTTPSQNLKACPVCGKVHVVENGVVTASKNMINDDEQVTGGDIIKNTGVCDSCGN